MEYLNVQKMIRQASRKKNEKTDKLESEEKVTFLCFFIVSHLKYTYATIVGTGPLS